MQFYAFTISPDELDSTFLVSRVYISMIFMFTILPKIRFRI